ncbi:hypothetical protein [Streptomyces sp. NPDC002044]|uniref:hypothetical protein n=1 Tax=Streptomyces sp. NPDC002044 TaxID=3154662 RepID=UPI003317F8BC
MGGVSENRPPRPRRRRPLRVAVGLLVLFAVIGYFAAQRNSNGGGAPYCTAAAAGADPEEYELSPEQAANAATIAAVGISKGLPDRAVTIALATAMQESALRNLDHGDRDSLGLFQQRPSMGWGTPEEITDPVYSAAVFYDHLVEVPGYSRLPLTVAAQKVQRSGFPQAYAKHEPDATVLTAAFGGAGTLVCSGPVPAAGDPERVRAELVRAFGKEALGEGPAPAADAPGAAAGAAAEGRVDVRLKRDGGAAEERRGRAVAHWAVARSQELGIARVSYGGGDWTGGRAGRAWQPRAADGASGGGGRPDAPGGEVRIFTAR